MNIGLADLKVQEMFFIIVVTAYLAANVLVFLKFNAALSGFPLVARIIFGCAYWVAALSFIAYMLFDRVRLMPVKPGHFFYWFSTSWLVFILYVSLLLLAFTLLQLFGVTVKGQLAWSTGLSLLLMAYGFFNFCTPTTRHLSLDVGKPAPGAKSMRVVAVSDVHLGYGVTRDRLERLVEMVNASRPDVVLIAGDLVDMSTYPLVAEKMDEPLRGINAPTYMVPGNHEYISGIGACEAFISSTPIVLLRDTVVSLPSGLQIVGRDDASNRRRKPLAELFEAVDPNKPVIVIDHQPKDAEVSAAVELGADMLLCGHTHKGQIWPLNLVTGMIYKHSYGYYKEDETNIYVSSGFGLWGPPYRIGTRSELVVMDIKIH